MEEEKLGGAGPRFLPFHLFPIFPRSFDVSFALMGERWFLGLPPIYPSPWPFSSPLPSFSGSDPLPCLAKNPLTGEDRPSAKNSEMRACTGPLLSPATPVTRDFSGPDGDPMLLVTATVSLDHVPFNSPRALSPWKHFYLPPVPPGPSHNSRFFGVIQSAGDSMWKKDWMHHRPS